MNNYRMHIDGQWCDAASGETFDAINPATGDTDDAELDDGFLSHNAVVRVRLHHADARAALLSTGWPSCR